MRGPVGSIKPVTDAGALSVKDLAAAEEKPAARKGYPTMQEVLNGLKDLLDDKIRLNTKRMKQRLIDAIQITYEEVYQEILRCLAIPNLDIELNEIASDFNYSLVNPLSKAVFLILYFYSVEPPFYHVINEACRT